mmetsp:Transcript_21235/g.59034  ORF Transcript_21235/g.59034 Transcript_21235/m.59034 type:complete len:261 (+) Transcript_21235:1114-1896(+)
MMSAKSLVLTTPSLLPSACRLLSCVIAASIISRSDLPWPSFGPRDLMLISFSMSVLVLRAACSIILAPADLGVTMELAGAGVFPGVLGGSSAGGGTEIFIRVPGAPAEDGDTDSLAFLDRFRSRLGGRGVSGRRPLSIAAVSSRRDWIAPARRKKLILSTARNRVRCDAFFFFSVSTIVPLSYTIKSKETMPSAGKLKLSGSVISIFLPLSSTSRKLRIIWLDRQNSSFCACISSLDATTRSTSRLKLRLYRPVGFSDRR